jgi:Spy/CpxP family protein refolding chaperone
MKAKVQQLFVCAMVAVLASCASVSNAQPAAGNPRGPETGRGEDLDNLINGLNLTPQQQAQIKKQRNEHFEKSRGVSDELRQKRLKLKQELEKETPARQAINTLVADINALTARKLEDRVDSILSIKEVLTPQQYKALQEKIKNHAGTQKERPPWRGQEQERGF